MLKITISMLQLFEIFPDQLTARKYLEYKRWYGKTNCPNCGLLYITTRKGKKDIDRNLSERSINIMDEARFYQGISDYFINYSVGGFVSGMASMLDNAFCKRLTYKELIVR